MSSNLQNPVVVEPNGGALWNILGSPMSLKVSAEQTNGAYSVVENTIPVGVGVPPHVHHNEDEIFYVLEGEFEIHCGGKTFTANKGAFAVLPKNLPHSFRNTGETEGKVLTTITPGGFENFFAELDREITTMPPDVEKMKAIGDKYNLEFLF